MVVNSEFKKLLGNEYTHVKWGKFIEFCIDNGISVNIHEPDPQMVFDELIKYDMESWNKGKNER